MSTSTVKLYYSGGTYGNWELLPGRLLCVDYLEYYLATKSCLTLSSVQFQQLKLEMTIKLDLSQHYSAPRTDLSFKYISIQNTDESVHYYFVKNVFWRSVSCVEFELVMDVLNTFKEGTDYDFKRSTNIIREHKSRFRKANFHVSITFDIVELSEPPIQAGDNISLSYLTTPDVVAYEGKVEAFTKEGSDGEMTILFDFVYVDEFEQWVSTGREIIVDNGHDSIIVNVKLVEATNEWYNEIDYIPEGINPSLFRSHEFTTEIVDNPPLQDSWYLLYRNQSEPDADHQFINPVDCYLIPEKWVSVKVSSITAGKMNANSLESGKYYMNIIVGTGIADVYTLDDGTNIGATSLGTHAVFIVLYKNANDRIVVSMCEGDIANPSDNVFPLASYETKTLTINHLPQSYKEVNALPTGHSYTAWNNVYNGGTSGSWTSGDVNLSTDDISNLDRTDSRNIKLIKLPYCPYDFTITGGMIDISNDTNWEYASCQDGGTCYCLKLIKDAKLQKDFEGAPLLSYLRNTTMDELPHPPANTDSRYSSLLDPKLLHSEFHREAYFYDSFEKDIDLEKLDLDWYLDNSFDLGEFEITFTMTKTINSRFMFTFKDCHMRLSDSNIPLVLPVARNNEEVLYNVPYVNYIRTGFNYDVKAKTLQVGSNVWGAAMSGASSLAALVAPSVTLKAVAIVGAVISFANSVKGAIVSAANADNSIKRKFEETKRQTDSVQGSDDVDLMTEYCGNRLRYSVYAPNPLMKSYLNDLFFYAGYRTNRMGIPLHINRINFDYLECEAQIESIRSIPSDCLAELINSFRSGVTYIHHNPSIGWDFEQTHENWERFIFD